MWGTVLQNVFIKDGCGKDRFLGDNRYAGSVQVRQGVAMSVELWAGPGGCFAHTAECVGSSSGVEPAPGLVARTRLTCQVQHVCESWDNSHGRSKDYSAVKVLVWEGGKGLWAPLSIWVTELEALKNRKMSSPMCCMLVMGFFCPVLLSFYRVSFLHFSLLDSYPQALWFAQKSSVFS